jgi:hypothetical protein
MKHPRAACCSRPGAVGCGYSLAGRGSFLPAYIKRIGVPQFTNNTRCSISIGR